MIFYQLLQKITSSLPLRGLPIVLNRLPFLSSVRMVLRVGDIDLCLRLSNSVMRNIYFGAFEKHVMTLMRDLLNPGDVFVDVGANIGFLSAYARTLTGPEGEIHSFEPVPEFAGGFAEAITKASVKNIFTNACAVGAEAGSANLSISGESNIGWNTIVPGFMNNAVRTVSVPVRSLSEYFESKSIQKVGLIKIDVEGAEWLVLKGLEKAFLRGLRPTIICETSPEGCRRLGVSLADIFRYMSNFGYKPHKFRRKGIYRFYTGKVILESVAASELHATEDIVWLQ